jgi:hypothetical protein
MRPTYSILLPVTVLLACIPMSAAGADVHFAAVERVFTACDAAAGTLVASFRFTNTGARTVRVHAIAPACDCETATLDRSEYTAGTSGVIVVALTIAPGPKAQRRAIRVVVDDEDGGDPHHLELAVRVEPAPAARFAVPSMARDMALWAYRLVWGG